MKSLKLSEIVAAAEKKAIISSLRRHRGNGNGSGPDIAAMVRELGINRVTLWRKMKAYGLRTRILVEV